MKNLFVTYKTSPNGWRVLVLVLAYILTSQGWLQGFVLCFESNGKTHVEPAYTEKFNLLARECFDRDMSFPKPQIAQANHHCGPCMDIPLYPSKVEEIRSLRPVLLDNSTEAAVLPFPHLSLVLPEENSGKSLFAPHAFAFSSLTSLRAVVLLM